MKRSYLLLAPGFEEVEALTTVDVLRRAGMDIRMAVVMPNGVLQVTGAHNITVVGDINIADVAPEEDAEWIICPGGMPGASNLHNSDRVTEILTAQAARGGNIAAICASPAVVLAPLGILDGRQATCYPGFEGMIADGEVVADDVVASGNVVTANGPASSALFALSIVAATMGDDKAREVADGMLL